MQTSLLSFYKHWCRGFFMQVHLSIAIKITNLAVKLEVSFQRSLIFTQVTEIVVLRSYRYMFSVVCYAPVDGQVCLKFTHIICGEVVTDSTSIDITWTSRLDGENFITDKHSITVALSKVKWGLRRSSDRLYIVMVGLSAELCCQVIWQSNGIRSHKHIYVYESPTRLLSIIITNENNGILIRQPIISLIW